MAISIYYQNINGMKSKTTDIHNNILCNNFDLICLCETWLNDSILSSELFDDRYLVIRRDRDAKFHKRFNKSDGGGVLFALAKGLDFVVRNDWQSYYVEDLWIQIKLKKFTINICIVYLPDYLPSEMYIEFLSKCSVIFSNNPNNNNLIIGDFNLPLINWTPDMSSPLQCHCEKSRSLYDFFHLSNLRNLNSVLNTNNRILDLVISDIDNGIVINRSVPISREDVHHPPLEILFTNKENTLQNAIIEKICFRKTKYEECIKEIENFEWEKHASELNCEDFLQLFYNTLYTIIEKYTPKTKSRKSNYPTWFSISLIRIIKEKAKYHNRYKKFRNPRDYDCFSMLRSRVKDMMNDCFRTYISSIEEDLLLNIKSFWRYTKNKRVTNSIPNRMYYNDRTATTGQDICNLFSDYFSTVYSTSASVNYTPDFPSRHHSISSIEFTEEQVLVKLKNLNLNKGAGPDSIPPVFVRVCATVLAKPLTLIFNKSMSSGVFPALWKITKGTPIFKSGVRNNVEDYRQVCILNCFAKVFEGLIYDQLYVFLKPILSPSQHGFVNGRSTNSNLLVYTAFLCKSFNVNKQVDSIYTDFAKAFDRVNHSILLSKAYHLGIHGNLHRWITSYLMNRTQLVCLNGFDSVPFIAESGVPQGSNLGPLLFLLFINDLLYRFDSNCLAYADDVKIYRPINDIDDCEILQKDINTILRWCVVNDMKLNNEKCLIITFTKARNPIKYTYQLQNIDIKRVNVVKDLGVLFDAGLSFRAHYDYMCSKANRMLSFILRLSKPFKRTESLIILYNSIVRTILEYCCSVWFPIYQVHIDRIESIQRRFMRALVSRLGLRRKIPNYCDRLQRFNMLSLEKRRCVSDLTTLFKVANGSFGAQLLELIQFKVPARSVRFPKLFHVPPVNNNVSYNNPINRMCNTYNGICANVDIFNTSITCFKNDLIKLL
ncbi:hypothetical protein JYU34_011770 [Plutella xylostella]|uniref:Reverse transcriptase domain-containing protein n=1 Tax=Plutella xylostella TaxID=51655 RepID=A0ABQ7QDG9_PLUXY|nr:hypothetical protein JYU34_011770 [Plutella xylostella]